MPFRCVRLPRSRPRPTTAVQSKTGSLQSLRVNSITFSLNDIYICIISVHMFLGFFFVRLRLNFFFSFFAFLEKFTFSVSQCQLALFLQSILLVRSVPSGRQR